MTSAPASRPPAGRVVALCGGVGGAKLAFGLERMLGEALTLIVNTGDDFEHLGLSISPDVDTVLYTLAGLQDKERGWGRAGESWNFMAGLGELGGETWFNLGDRDLALHVWRSQQMRAGRRLTDIIGDVARRFAIGATILPMSDNPIRTIVETPDGPLAFQRYFVERRCAPRLLGVRFEGLDRARLSAPVRDALRAPDLKAIVICPSNPFLSVDPILATPGLRALIEAAEAPVVAVSPLIGGAAVKGPTAKIMSRAACSDHSDGDRGSLSRSARWAHCRRRGRIPKRFSRRRDPRNAHLDGRRCGSRTARSGGFGFRRRTRNGGVARAMTARRVEGGAWAIVPVKRFDRAKSRLSAVLAPGERALLAKAMLGDVLDQLARAPSLRGVVVVTGDADARALADEFGFDVAADPRDEGVNAAVLRGITHARACGASAVVVVPGDIPFVTVGELDIALGALAAANVALARAARDGGTNMLALCPLDAIAPAFGEDSFARHVAATRASGSEALVFDLAGASRDIDVAADLVGLAAFSGGQRTRACLLGFDVAGRVESARSGKGHTVSKSMAIVRDLCDRSRLTREQGLALVDTVDVSPLLAAATRRRDAAHGAVVSYSRKVFIPLTQLCRDVCHYCTFAHPPRPGVRAYLTRDEVVAIAEAGKRAGCKEALFTLGDKPELRYRQARDELRALGHETTLAYLAEVAALVRERTGLLPHVNPGVMGDEDLAALRRVSISQGLMLESAAERLCGKGQPHFGSPDKRPRARLDTLRRAGEQAIPVTSGLLIGIGETREERIEAMIALRDLNDAHGHIQEIIIQNFRPKPGTRMAEIPPPSLDDHLWTIAIARLLFEPSMNIQAPPNLNPDDLTQLVAAGVNDWGGVSPVTIDYVNPEAPWPHLEALEAATRRAGKTLNERLAIYPRFARDPDAWVDAGLRKPLFDWIDGDGWPRQDEWRPGRVGPLPARALGLLRTKPRRRAPEGLRPVLDKARAGVTLEESDIVALFRARGDAFAAVCREADELRREVNGDIVSYVVTRNINYTNICSFKCQFCAFSKGKLSENLRGRPYDLEMEEVARRVGEAWGRGASEVCMQGGIHPSYTGDKYLEICRVTKAAAPHIHIHAFSPLEVSQGAKTLGLSPSEFLVELKRAGLGTLPGTAAEILDEEVSANALPGQGEYAGVARRGARRASRRLAFDGDDHVRAHRPLRALGTPYPARARIADGDGRLHGIRAIAVRAHGSSDLFEGPCASGSHVPRGSSHARGRASGVASAHFEHPGVVGEARRRGRERVPERRRQ